MKALQLSKGIIALLDDDTFDWLKYWSWSVAAPSQRLHYGRRKMVHPSTHKPQFIYLHRIIAGVNEDFKISFRDGNPLNMQRENLRFANGLDQEILWDGSRGESLFLGVVWDRYYGLWRSQVEDLTIGYFVAEFDAAIAYNNKVRKLFGASAEQNNLDAVCQRR